MVKTILLVTSDLAQSQAIIRLAKDKPFEFQRCGTAAEASRILSAAGEGLIAIFDLDGMELDERYFRQLPKAPDRCLMGISHRPFHPDLKEAIGQHLTACLRKPVDSDELLFLLDSFAKNGCALDR